MEPDAWHPFLQMLPTLAPNIINAPSAADGDDPGGGGARRFAARGHCGGPATSAVGWNPVPALQIWCVGMCVCVCVCACACEDNGAGAGVWKCRIAPAWLWSESTLHRARGSPSPWVEVVLERHLWPSCPPARVCPSWPPTARVDPMAALAMEVDAGEAAASILGLLQADRWRVKVDELMNIKQGVGCWLRCMPGNAGEPGLKCRGGRAPPLAPLLLSCAFQTLLVGAWNGESAVALELEPGRGDVACTRMTPLLLPAPPAATRPSFQAAAKLLAEAEACGVLPESDASGRALITAVAICREWQLCTRGVLDSLASATAPVGGYEALAAAAGSLIRAEAELPFDMGAEPAALAEGSKLFCLCRTPYDDQRPMLGCDFCAGWYHYECVGLRIPGGDDPEGESQHRAGDGAGAVAGASAAGGFPGGGAGDDDFSGGAMSASPPGTASAGRSAAPADDARGSAPLQAAPEGDFRCPVCALRRGVEYPAFHSLPASSVEVLRRMAATMDCQRLAQPVAAGGEETGAGAGAAAQPAEPDSSSAGDTDAPASPPAGSTPGWGPTAGAPGSATPIRSASHVGAAAGTPPDEAVGSGGGSAGAATTSTAPSATPAVTTASDGGAEANRGSEDDPGSRDHAGPPLDGVEPALEEVQGGERPLKRARHEESLPAATAVSAAQPWHGDAVSSAAPTALPE